MRTIVLPAKETGYRRVSLFRKAGKCGVCLVTVIMVMFLPKAYSQDIDYSIYANIIYRFTKYIEWPDSKKSGDFIIGIAGESPLTGILNDFTAGKTAGNQKIVIKVFARSETIYNCQILFISDDENINFKKIVVQTRDRPILLVTESDGSAQNGSCINFIIVSSRLKLEISKNNILQRHLNIATELLQLGTLIK